MDPMTLPLLTLVGGGILGFFSSIVLLSIRQRQDIALKVLDQYLSVRREVVCTVAELADLDLLAEVGDEKLVQHKKRVAQMYYHHFDLLPAPVLNAMVLLHVCLARPDGGPYKIQGDVVCPMTEEEVIEFIRQCSLFANARYLAPLALNSPDRAVRVAQVVRLHSRHVLYTLNEFATVAGLLDLTRGLRKPLYRRRQNRSLKWLWATRARS